MTGETNTGALFAWMSWATAQRDALRLLCLAFEDGGATHTAEQAYALKNAAAKLALQAPLLCSVADPEVIARKLFNSYAPHVNYEDALADEREHLVSMAQTMLEHLFGSTGNAG